MGLYALGQQTGTGDIARGELMRYMMEAAWYPTALLFQAKVRSGWQRMRFRPTLRWRTETSA
jgi:hypothetical protein